MTQLYLSKIISLCASRSWVPWETYSETVYWEEALSPTAREDDGIRTGQRGPLDGNVVSWRPQTVPSGAPGLVLQRSLKMRQGVEALYSLSDHSLDTG